MRGWCYARSGCCGCGLWWRRLTAPRLTRTLVIAIATWRDRLASTGISRGPRRCHDGGWVGLRAGIVPLHRRVLHRDRNAATPEGNLRGAGHPVIPTGVWGADTPGEYPGVTPTLCWETLC